MFAAGALPRVLFGSVAGVFVDRWDRKRTMVVADLLRAVVLLPLLTVRSTDLLWVIYLVGFVQSAISLFFGPARSAVIPRLVGQQHLLGANSLNAISNAFARVVGPALCIETLLQSSVADCFRGRVFGTLGTTIALTSLEGMGLGSVLGTILGTAAVLGLAGGLFALSGVLALVLMPSARLVTTSRQYAE